MDDASPDEPGLDARAAELEAAWCVAVDGHHLDQVRCLFAADGIFTTRGTPMKPAERDAFFRHLWDTGSDRSTHVTRAVKATQDGEKVHIRAELSATFIQADGSIRVVWGHYDDEARITPDGLRFTSKQVNLERSELLGV